MRIAIDLGNPNYQKETERLLHLFFEEDEVSFDAQEDAALLIRVWTEEEANSVTARAELHDRRDGRSYTSFFTKVLEPGLSANLRMKRGKPAVLRALHDLLEQLTGEHQPWGILFGVRPLKLVHNMREQGRDNAYIRQTLRNEHAISAERIDLLMEIVDAQLATMPDLYEIDKEVSIYVGIPFCPTHCAYCTFPAYSMEDKATYAPSFLDALDREFAAIGAFLQEYNIPVTSVYLGGGTPTSLKAPELERVMKGIYAHIPGSQRWREFTVEAGRPDTITPERVEVMRRYGVNRISVNPQTFKAETLKTIGRGHTPDIVDKRFHLVKEAGFENINMDMILGLPGEDLDDVRHTRQRIEALNPDSVTVHTMSFKRTAVVNKERDQYTIPHTRVVRQMMAETAEWARGLGYHPYYVYRQKDILGNLENVGYAQPGKDSIYNIAIMEERQTIIGLGGGASSKLYRKGEFLSHVYNAKEPKAYVDSVEQVIEKKLNALREVFAPEEIKEPRSV
ncbi:coproporphyrinogen dehydrogenase HemZ [Tumebacillus permanentifrigoris]|uniref:Anaerobic coproporphyrinogen III oxidase n=1 Tax=Tumebacillus permanentifrigoris TaxID=378543 RepID=A0A316D5W2_9BACL|nr:coproporphyrinogen dehydrogenase HemZ [Tumebacillus permanentifrigoris]PWK09060.1 anaerobic coproporphyrinogen III oxidase [Tumebacillus permanentifrigoris]